MKKSAETELQTKIPEDYAPAFSWLKMATRAFTLKTLCETGVNPR